MVAAIGTGEAFVRGRDFGASLPGSGIPAYRESGLGRVPRQFSTGGKPVLGRISKRGSTYFRALLIQAAHVILMPPHDWPHFIFGLWLEQAPQRLHKNKMARIAWSVLRHGKTFDVDRIEATVIRPPDLEPTRD